MFDQKEQNPVDQLPVCGLQTVYGLARGGEWPFGGGVLRRASKHYPMRINLQQIASL